MKEILALVKKYQKEIKDFFDITIPVDIFFWKENIILKNESFYWTDGIGVYPITQKRHIVEIYKKDGFTAILYHEHYHPYILYTTNDFREE